MKNKKIKKIINKIEKRTKEAIKGVVSLTEKTIGRSKISYKKKYRYNLNIIKKKNPFLTIRKNYKKFYKIFIKGAMFTPNLLKFFHILHWPKNIDYFWRNINLGHPLENKKRETLINKIKKKTNIENLFTLIFRKNNINRLIEFTKIKNNYTNKLKTLYVSNFSNKANYMQIETPEFINKKREWKEFFMLKFRQRSLVRTLIRFYFPLTSIKIKERTIHSLPLKTKKPRRV